MSSLSYLAKPLQSQEISLNFISAFVNFFVIIPLFAIDFGWDNGDKTLFNTGFSSFFVFVRFVHCEVMLIVGRN